MAARYSPPHLTSPSRPVKTKNCKDFFFHPTEAIKIKIKTDNISKSIEMIEGKNGMKANVGRPDRVVRVVLGIIIIAAGLYFKSWWGIIGLAPLLTAAIGWCPAYVPFGISSCRVK